MAKVFSKDELVAETGASPRADRLDDQYRDTQADRPGAVRFGDVFRVKLVGGLLEGGFTSQQVERAVSQGHLNLDRADEYLPAEPGPRSERTFAQFMSAAGPRASLLPRVLGFRPAWARPGIADRH